MAACSAGGVLTESGDSRCSHWKAAKEEGIYALPHHGTPMCAESNPRLPSCKGSSFTTSRDHPPRPFPLGVGVETGSGESTAAPPPNVPRSASKLPAARAPSLMTEERSSPGGGGKSQVWARAHPCGHTDERAAGPRPQGQMDQNTVDRGNTKQRET
jgi:hypothetical protein